MNLATRLPHNPDAERSVLGAILLDNHALNAAVEVLRPEDFFLEQHRRLYSHMIALGERQRAIDLITLAEELERAGELEAAGGGAYLAQLVDGVPRVTNVAHYANIVRENSELRRLVHLAEAMKEAAASGDVEGATNHAKTAIVVRPALNSSGTAWNGAEGMDTFLDSDDDGADFLDNEKRILARASITEIFSPRGLCKSIFMLWLSIQLSSRGLRVLVLDRDNPRHVVRSRLKSLGAHSGIPTLKVLSREKCPPLTNSAAWASFPYAEHDVVCLDSLDSAAEGVGEQDSAKPARAIAPLLDIARRENGPAVLILGNTVRLGTHSRGSGVIEDRADIVYEIRDVTGFSPTGSKAWHEELPAADAGSWASRASRRKQREIFRLAFIATKFRVGVEPEPFVMEIDLRAEPWCITDATDTVDREGAVKRAERAKERVEMFARARDALVAEISKRYSAGELMLKDRDAVPFLMKLGLKRVAAREVIQSNAQWTSERIEGQKGHPIGLLPTGKNEAAGGNGPVMTPAETQAINNADFCRSHPERSAEIARSKTQTFRGYSKPAISAKQSLFTPPTTVLEGEL